MMIDLTENIINCICHKREMGCLSIIVHTHIYTQTFYHIIILIHYIYLFIFYCYWTGTGIKILSIEINTRTIYFYVLFVISSVVQCLIPRFIFSYQYFFFVCVFRLLSLSNKNVWKKKINKREKYGL